MQTLYGGTSPILLRYQIISSTNQIRDLADLVALFIGRSRPCTRQAIVYTGKYWP